MFMYWYILVVILFTFHNEVYGLIEADRYQALHHISEALGPTLGIEDVNIGGSINNIWDLLEESMKDASINTASSYMTWRNNAVPFVACVQFAAYTNLRETFSQEFPHLMKSLQRFHHRADKNRACVQVHLRSDDYESLKSHQQLQFLALEPVSALARMDESIIKLHLHQVRHLTHSQNKLNLFSSPSEDELYHPLLVDLHAYPSDTSTPSEDTTNVDTNGASKLILSIIFRKGLSRVQQEQIITQWRTKLRTNKVSSRQALLATLDLTHNIPTSKWSSALTRIRKLPTKTANSAQSHVLHHYVHTERLDHLINSDFTAQCLQLPRFSVRLSKRGAHIEIPAQFSQAIHFNSMENERLQAMFCLNSFVQIIASTPEVVRVGYSKPFKVLNNYARPLLQGGGYTSSYEVFTPIGLNGTGVILGVSDTGIDENSCYFQDKALGRVKRTSIEEAFFDLNYRKVIQYVNYSGSGGDYSSGHGSHVAGTLAGLCSLDDSHASTANLHKGMSSAAKLAFFDIGTNSASMELIVPYDLGGDIFAPAYTAGARIHSNSWGGGYFYDAYALAVDEYLSNVRPDFSVFFAGGNNGGSGRQTILSPGVSKNCIAVGATETGHTNGQNVNYVAFFSSTGPTFDNRLKPDVLAPGYSIYSARARNENTQTESCDVEAKAGTSMATPALAGTAGLILQYFVTDATHFWRKYCNPLVPYCQDGENVPWSAAMMKAMILQGAQAVQMYNGGRNSPVGKVSLADHRPPDYFQGYGRFVLRNLLKVTEHQPGDNFLFLQESVLYELTEDVYQVTIPPASTPSTAHPLKITIAWTDPVNDFFTAQLLQHDIDVQVISPTGALFKGNAPVSLGSDGLDRPAIGSHRDEDNVNEQVFIQYPTEGNWTIRVQMKYMLHPFVHRVEDDDYVSTVETDTQRGVQRYAMVLSTHGVVTRIASQRPISVEEFAPQSQCAVYMQHDAAENAEVGIYELGVALWSRVKSTAWNTNDYLLINQTRYVSSISDASASNGDEVTPVSYPKAIIKATFPTNGLTNKLPVAYSQHCLPAGDYVTDLHLSSSVSSQLGSQVSLPDCDVFLAPFASSQQFRISRHVHHNASHATHTHRLQCLPSIVYQNHLTMTLNLTEYYGGAGWSGAYYVLIPKPSSSVTQRVAGTMEWDYELQKHLRIPLPTSTSSNTNTDQCYLLFLSSTQNKDLSSDESPEVYFANAERLTSSSSSAAEDNQCPFFLNQTNSIASFCVPTIHAMSNIEDVTVVLRFHQSSDVVTVNYGQKPLPLSSEPEATQLWRWMEQSPVFGTCLVSLKSVAALSEGRTATETPSSVPTATPTTLTPTTLTPTTLTPTTATPSLAPVTIATSSKPSTVPAEVKEEDTVSPSATPTTSVTHSPTRSSLATGVSYGGRDVSCLSACVGFPGNDTLRHDLDKSCLFLNLLVLQKCDSFALSLGHCVLPACVTHHCVPEKIHDLWCYLAGGAVESCPVMSVATEKEQLKAGDEVDDGGLVWRFEASQEATQVYAQCMRATLLVSDSDADTNNVSPAHSSVSSAASPLIVTCLTVAAVLLSVGIVCLLGLQAFHFATGLAEVTGSTGIADPEPAADAQKVKRKRTRRGYEMVALSGSEHGHEVETEEDEEVDLEHNALRHRGDVFTIHNHSDDEDEVEDEVEEEDTIHLSTVSHNVHGSGAVSRVNYNNINNNNNINNIPKIQPPPASVSTSKTPLDKDNDNDNVVNNPMLSSFMVATQSEDTEEDKEGEEEHHPQQHFAKVFSQSMDPSSVSPHDISLLNHPVNSSTENTTKGRDTRVSQELDRRTALLLHAQSVSTNDREDALFFASRDEDSPAADILQDARTLQDTARDTGVSVGQETTRTDSQEEREVQVDSGGQGGDIDNKDNDNDDDLRL